MVVMPHVVDTVCRLGRAVMVGVPTLVKAVVVVLRTAQVTNVRFEPAVHRQMVCSLVAPVPFSDNMRRAIYDYFSIMFAM